MSVCLDVLSVLFFKILDFLLVILLSLLELSVPVFIKLLVLFDVSLFTLLALLFVQKDELLHLGSELLFLKLSNPILGKFCLDVTALRFARCSVLLHSNTTSIVNKSSKWRLMANPPIGKKPNSCQ